MSAALPIAVIDDDPAICVSIECLLRSLGYRVATFPSAEAFLGSEAIRDYVCVISDVQMEGGMSGIELAGRLKATGGMPPIILISAFADAKVQADAKQAGARCLLKKPFDGGSLIACLDDIVERR